MGARIEELEAVYRRDFRRFLVVAASIVHDEQAAYDVVQEAFARALRHRGGFRRSGSIEGWLWRTVVNVARDARARPAPVREPSRNGGGPAHETSLRAAVALLPERQRLALFLHYYADLDYRAIAEAMGISTGTVGATLNAARATLRRHLVEVER